ncbi:hypothetical protein LOAG_14010, partial [Loa loa]
MLQASLSTLFFPLFFYINRYNLGLLQSKEEWNRWDTMIVYGDGAPLGLSIRASVAFPPTTS